MDKEEIETVINKLQINSENTDEESDNDCQCSCCNSESYESSDDINVLSTEERFILETIDTIKDPTEKITQLNKYLNLAKEPRKQTS